MSKDDPRHPTPIAMDDRPIEIVESVSADQEGDPSFFFSTRPGRWQNCTHIEAYEEPGQMSMVPFYAIFSGENIIARVPAHFAIAHYPHPKREEK